MSETRYTVALALGANIGNRAVAMRMAAEKVVPYVTVMARSALYETPAAYITDQPAFLNAVIVGTTVLEPLPLLWALKNLESEIGRTPTFRYGPRVIDIDILFYGDVVLEMPELILPHPRMAERDFVLRPLHDVAPDWVHPVTHKTIRDMLDSLPASPIHNLGVAW